MALPLRPTAGHNDSPEQANPFIVPQTTNVPSVLKADEGLIPKMPKPAFTSQTGNTYRTVGHLTFEDVMKYDFETVYLPLEERILRITEKIQHKLIQNQLSEEITKARLGDEKAQREVGSYIDSNVVSVMDELGIQASPPEKAVMAARVVNEIIGSGPIDPLMKNPAVTEIMISGPRKIYIEMGGKLTRVPGVGFRDSQHALALAERILANSGRTISEKSPLEDGRLLDFSRFNVVHPTVAKDGPYMTIRRQRAEIWTVKELVNRNSMTPEIATELVNLVYAGCTTVIVGGTGTGKALSISTPIPTPHGFILMGDLHVGAKVLDENGEPVTVTGVYDQGRRTAYKVSFTDGTSVIADAEHNWLTYDRAARRSLSRRKTVEASGSAIPASILTQLQAWHESLDEDENLSIKEIVTEHPEIEYRVRMSATGLTKRKVGNAYYFCGREILARIIDAGSVPPHSQQKRWTRPQVRTTAEIAESLYAASGHLNHAVPRLESAVEYPMLADMHLEAFYEAGKHGGSTTPPEYMLIGSIAQRTALVAGFVDTFVKTITTSGSVILTLPTESARFLQSVCSSLGIYACTKPNSKNSKLSNVTIKTHQHIFTLGSKQDLVHQLASENIEVPDFRYILSVEKVGEEEMRCISVDSDTRLYLCGHDYIVTHNTTVLNALSGAIPPNDSIITIEDNFELKLHPERNVRAVESRPPNASDQGAVTIRQHVKNALRMRPDRIVVGEVRGAEAFDMLQAMNTGHDGSMTTFHANGADEAIDRLASMASQSGEVDKNSALSLIASGVDLMITIDRYEDGSRRISGIYEIPRRPTLVNGLAELIPIPIWEFHHEINLDTEEVKGEYVRVNEISDHLKRSKRLHVRKPFTTEEAYKISDLGQ